MADDLIREGEPDEPRTPYTDGGDGDDARVPDIRKHPSEIEFAGQFHQQIVALGVLWVLMFGVVPGVAAYRFASQVRGESGYLAILLAGSALVWTVLGVLACRRHMWAVRIGLVLSYLIPVITVADLVWGGPAGGGGGCLYSALFVILSILQAHRVIGFARKMRAAGIPLDRMPE